MAKYRVLKGLVVDDARYGKGDTVELDEKAAKSLLEDGVITKEKPSEEEGVRRLGSEPKTQWEEPRKKKSEEKPQ
jgi:hypothetical protein